MTVLLLSLLLAPFLGQHYDPNVIAYDGVQVVNGINPYTGGWWNGYAYPPLYLYYSSFVGYLLNDIPLNSLPEFRTPALHILLIKLPSIVSHQAIATVMYRSTNPKFPKYFSYLYLVSPFPIFISAIWGNIDELCAIFLLLCVIYMYKGKWTLAGLMWGTACVLKVYVLIAVIILPLLVINSKQKATLRKSFSFLVASSGLFLVVSLPFMLWNMSAFLSTLFWRIGFSGWQHDVGLSYTVTLWALLNDLGNPFSFLVLIPPAVFIILLSYYILQLYRSNHKFKDFDELNSSILVLILISFLSTMVVNEMNYVWAMPFLLIYWIKRDKQAGKRFMILNIILLAAVMIDWTPIDFIPGANIAIVPTYQVTSIFRYVALGSLGWFVSIAIVLDIARRIFRELRV